MVSRHEQENLRNERFLGRTRFIDDAGEERLGEVLERNGNLTLVEDERGEPHWLSPFELRREDDS